MIALDQTQLGDLRRRLEQDREQLRAEIDRIAREDVSAEAQYDSSEFSGVGNHPAETGTEIFEQERGLALEQSLGSQLADVEHALEKFTEGTYGICDNCGKQISVERLQALPRAALCIDCKGKLETKQA